MTSHEVKINWSTFPASHPGGSAVFRDIRTSGNISPVYWAQYNKHTDGSVSVWWDDHPVVYFQGGSESASKKLADIFVRSEYARFLQEELERLDTRRAVIHGRLASLGIKEKA